MSMLMIKSKLSITSFCILMNQKLFVNSDQYPQNGFDWNTDSYEFIPKSQAYDFFMKFRCLIWPIHE